MTVPLGAPHDGAEPLADPTPADRSMQVLEVAMALVAVLAALLLGIRPA